VGGGKLAPLTELAPAHEASASDLAVGLALAHAHEGLSVVMHLESPARHPWTSGQKPQR
jgi:hypothetical protein